MKVTEIKSIYPYLYRSKFVGVGTTAICFKMPNNKVLRLYLDTYRKNLMFKHYNMYEKLNKLETIKNDSYIVPEELLIKDNEIIGYIYPYIHAKTLKRVINNNISINNLFNNYEKLISDTKKVSELDFIIHDLHSRNILFDGNYYIIDLDQGDFYKYQDNFKLNVYKIRDVIMDEIFKNNVDYILEFNNIDIGNTYRKINWANIDEVKYFFNYLSKYINKDNIKVKDIRKKILINKTYNSYYKN